MAVKIITKSITLLLGIFFVTASFATELPVAKDFAQDALLAKQKGIPILVFFAAPDCSYCEEVEELHLKPMFSSKKYAGKVIFRVVRVESVKQMRDFKGNLTSHEEFSSGKFVDFTPTIRMFRFDGKELSELYGFSTPDYYHYDLLETIHKSVAKLRRPKS